MWMKSEHSWMIFFHDRISNDVGNDTKNDVSDDVKDIIYSFTSIFSNKFHKEQPRLAWVSLVESFYLSMAFDSYLTNLHVCSFTS
jgi:hypothetical protein